MKRQGYVLRSTAAIVFATTALLNPLCSADSKEPSAKASASKAAVDKSSRPGEAQLLVDKALAAEATGNAQARSEYLQQALAADPDLRRPIGSLAK